MNFRNYADLGATVAKWQAGLPRDFTIICGVPRSGMLAANILALNWNLPLTDPDNLIAGRVMAGGRRLGATRLTDLSSRQKILVLDDSVNHGTSIHEVRQRLSALHQIHDIKYGAVYATKAGAAAVDYYAEQFENPRMFQWNMFHHAHLGKSCLDIDGLLCEDPLPIQNDDGNEYEKFLKTARAVNVPSVAVGWLVTGRLEKYRRHTVAWLDKAGIKYKELCMLDMPDGATRRRLDGTVQFKAGIYKASGAELFLESEHGQAKRICQLASKPVIATDIMQLFMPTGLSGITYSVERNVGGMLSRLKKRVVNGMGI